MSRIGKKPIQIPEGVEINVKGNKLFVKGPKGELSMDVRKEIAVDLKGGNVLISKKLETAETSAYWGLTRSLVANMIEGVTNGFKKELILEGIGYRASMDGRKLILSVGYSHPVEYTPPEGVEISVTDNTKVAVSGIDKNKVSQSAADIRKIRMPEPYKGKGIRYAGEVIRRKAGKAGRVGGGLGE